MKKMRHNASIIMLRRNICALEYVSLKLLLQFRFRLLLSASPIQKLIGYNMI